jgi:hypothetical protein
MINTIGAVSNADMLRASADTGTSKEWTPVNTPNVSAATDTFTTEAAGLRVGQEEYDKLFEGEEKVGDIKKSQGDIFSAYNTSVERKYNNGALECETVSIYKNEWLGLSQTLEQRIVSSRTDEGIKESITGCKNGEPALETVFINGAYYSTTHYGAYEENEDVTYYADGSRDVRTDYGNGNSKLENYYANPDEHFGISSSTSEFENSHLVRSRSNYEDGGYSVSTFGEDVLDRTSEYTYRADGTLKNSFVRHEDGRTKYKEFDADGETVTYEYPISFNGNN